MQHIAQLDIINKSRLAGDQLDGIHLALWLAHDAEIGRGTGTNKGCCTSSVRCIVSGRGVGRNELGPYVAFVVEIACAVFGMLQWRATWVPGFEVFASPWATDRCHSLTAQNGGGPHDCLYGFDVASAAA